MKYAKIILALMFTMMLTACGPMYQTHYDIIPPATQQGRMCANNCVMYKKQCESNCRSENNNCIMMNNLERQNHELMQAKTNTKSRYIPSRFCDSSGCEHGCKDDYHMCHRNCGGQVNERTVCVANCHKAKNSNLW